MNSKRLITYHLSLITLLLSSCNIFDPPVVVPVYGHVNSIPLTTNYLTQGTDSAYITDSWVYLDDNPVGVFQMPCTFPMIASAGMHNIQIYPGIMQDGIASTRSIYTFYSYLDTNLYLNPQSTYTFKHSVGYNKWVTFKYMENFDESGKVPAHLNNGPLGSTDATMLLTTSGAFQGGSGVASIDVAHPKYTGITDTIFGKVLPVGGTTVYLEMNYKCSTTFSVGLYNEADTNIQTPIVYINPTSTWKKMYVNLTPSIYTGLVEPIWVYFSFSIDSSNPSDTADQLYLDNLKVIY